MPSCIVDRVEDTSVARFEELIPQPGVDENSLLCPPVVGETKTVDAARETVGDVPDDAQIERHDPISQRLNPLGALSSVINDNLAQAHWELGDHEASLRAATRLLAELPDYYIGYVLMAMNQLELGRLEEAKASIERARQIQPDLSLELFQAMYGVDRPEVDARRNALLRQLGVE